jgi:hypothetical protein
MTLKIRRILLAGADGSATRVTQRAADLAAKSDASLELMSVAAGFERRQATTLLS